MTAATLARVVVEKCGHTAPTYDVEGQKLGEPGACVACTESALTAMRNQLPYEVLVTTSIEPDRPIAAFEYGDQAEEWAKLHYPDRYAIRELPLEPRLEKTNG